MLRFFKKCSKQNRVLCLNSDNLITVTVGQEVLFRHQINLCNVENTELFNNIYITIEKRKEKFISIWFPEVTYLLNQQVISKNKRYILMLCF